MNLTVVVIDAPWQALIGGALLILAGLTIHALLVAPLHRDDTPTALPSRAARLGDEAEAFLRTRNKEF
ncbi:hypothetical protein ABT336_00400 [Micromonospora sp. NPDC000207]|uniref:hypothetical protein n=1 Tax=Micromonospora sp. NPDC000207 TaxID=3154246 RepID=UPI00331A7823